MTYLRDSIIPHMPWDWTPKDPEAFQALIRATDSTDWLLDNNGKAYGSKRKTSFKKSFRAHIRLLFMVLDKPKIDLDKFLGGEGWHALTKLVDVRDALMHPHKLEDVMLDPSVHFDLIKAMKFQHELIFQLTGVAYSLSIGELAKTVETEIEAAAKAAAEIEAVEEL